nr:translation initiation factor IF-3 [Bacilli bacterium]
RPLFDNGGIHTIANFNPNDRRRPQKRFDPINEYIRYPEVMVIGPDGDNLGKMSSRAANELAASYNLDLFCVAPNANPPVCKILNYGKYRFEKQKSERAQKRNSKAAQLKEIQLHISIGEHDMATKAKHARGFLADGDKVNVRVVLKGREMAHKDLGEELLKKFIALLTDEENPINTEKAPSWEGKCYSSIVARKTKK